MLQSCSPQARKLYATIREELLAQGEAIGREEGYQAGYEEGYQEGRREGEAAMLLLLLTLRGFSVDDALRERIEQCEGVETIRRWFTRAVHADSLQDVFDE